MSDVKKPHPKTVVVKQEGGEHFVQAPPERWKEGSLCRMLPTARAWEQDYAEKLGKEGMRRGRAAQDTKSLVQGGAFVVAGPGCRATVARASYLGRDRPDVHYGIEKRGEAPSFVWYLQTLPRLVLWSSACVGGGEWPRRTEKRPGLAQILTILNATCTSDTVDGWGAREGLRKSLGSETVLLILPSDQSRPRTDHFCMAF